MPRRANRGPYVSRGGLKLEHALRHFSIDVAGLRCADLGCSTGGFTDCLLQKGVAHVHAVDTGYGVLDYTLRRDRRVTVHERTNAIHMEPPEPVDLVVIDLGWTPQRLALDAARRWLASDGAIVTLVKPPYEITDEERSAWLDEGVLPDEIAEQVAERVLASMESLGLELVGSIESPIRGGGSRGSGGNREWLAHLRDQR